MNRITGRTVAVKSGHAPHKKIDKGALIINLDDGMCFHLNGTGWRIWQLIDGKRKVSAIADAMAPEYSQPEDKILRDVTELVSQLRRAGLVDEKG